MPPTFRFRASWSASFASTDGLRVSNERGSDGRDSTDGILELPLAHDAGEQPEAVTTERRTLIVGRTTRRTHELEVIEQVGDPFPGPWQVKAVVDERAAPKAEAGRAKVRRAETGQPEAGQAETGPAEISRGPWPRAVDSER